MHELTKSAVDMELSVGFLGGAGSGAALGVVELGFGLLWLL